MSQRFMTRREMLKLMTVGGGAAVLAACGTAPAAQEPTSAPAVVSETGSTVNLTYWGSYSGGLGEAETALVEKFNGSQDEIVVEYQFQGSYEDTAQKFTAGLQADTIPEVVLLSDVWWFTFYVAGAISPLDDLAAQTGLDLTDFEPVLLNEGNRQGVNYWIPFGRSTPLFYYNKDIWAEAGLEDRAPANWAEFIEWAPQLVQKEGDTMTRAAFVHPNSASYIAWLFQGVTWQFGGQYSLDDFTMTMTDENTLRGAQFYQDTANSLGWALLASDISQEFLGGTAASMMASTGGLRSISETASFEVGVGFLPEETYFGCPTGGAGLAIPSSIPDEKKLAAMQYITYVTNPENAGFWARETGYMPTRISAKQLPEMVQFFEENPNFKTAVDQLPKTRAQDAARVYVRNGDQIIGKGLERIVVNNEAPATVFAEINDELTKAAEPILEDLKAIEG